MKRGCMEIENYIAKRDGETADGFVRFIAFGTYKGKDFYMPVYMSREFVDDSAVSVDDFVYGEALAAVKGMYERYFGKKD